LDKEELMSMNSEEVFTVGVTKEELRELFKDAIREAELVSEREAKKIAQDVLLHIGLDPSDFHEVRKDFYHLRGWRQSTEGIKRHGLLTIIGTLIVGALGALWYGLNHGG
jgi:hypothetical protein